MRSRIANHSAGLKEKRRETENCQILVNEEKPIKRIDAWNLLLVSKRGGKNMIDQMICRYDNEPRSLSMSALEKLDFHG